MSNINPWLSLGAIALMTMPSPGLRAAPEPTSTFIMPGSPLPSTPAPSPASDSTTTARPNPPIVERRHYDRYRQVIERTQAMVSDPIARQLAESFDLNVHNVTWEDTGRFYGSAVGPNISDMTIQVQQQNPDTGQYQLHLMPVIRHPNFADLSADISLDRFAVLVGNERGDDLRRVTLDDLLGDLRRYLHTPSSWAGRGRSLLAPARDSHVLVSAPGGLGHLVTQCCLTTSPIRAIAPPSTTAPRMSPPTGGSSFGSASVAGCPPPPRSAPSSQG